MGRRLWLVIGRYASDSRHMPECSAICVVIILVAPSTNLSRTQDLTWLAPPLAVYLKYIQ